MSTIADDLKNFINNKRHNPDMIPDVATPTLFKYVGQVHNIKELNDLPRDFQKDFNSVVVIEGSEGIYGTKGTYYYLNRKWNKWINSISAGVSFIDGINDFYGCLYDMLQFGVYEWGTFANVAKAFGIGVSIPDKHTIGTLDRLLLDNAPIAIYNAYKFYKETQSEKAKKKRTEAINDIIDTMHEFDISADDIRDHLSHDNVKSQINGEDIQIGKINEEPTNENVSRIANCKKCNQRPICLPDLNAQNNVNTYGCKGFVLDKSR